VEEKEKGVHNKRGILRESRDRKDYHSWVGKENQKKKGSTYLEGCPMQTHTFTLGMHPVQKKEQIQSEKGGSISHRKTLVDAAWGV